VKQFFGGAYKKKSALRGPEFFFALRATISVSAKCYPLSKLDS